MDSLKKSAQITKITLNENKHDIAFILQYLSAMLTFMKAFFHVLFSTEAIAIFFDGRKVLRRKLESLKTA